MPTDPEIELIPAETAEPSGHQQQDRVEQTVRRRKAGEENDRLAFEKGPNEGDQIGVRAVRSDQLIKIHSQPYTAASCRCGRPLDPGPPLVAARMLGFPATPVERIPGRVSIFDLATAGPTAASQR